MSNRKIVFQLERSFKGQKWEVIDIQEGSFIHDIFQNPERQIYDDGLGNQYRRIVND